jgi:hypothetical protein
MNKVLIKILIILLFVYSIYSNVIIAVFHVSIFKTLIAVLFIILFSFQFFLDHKAFQNKQILILPFLLIVIYILIRPQMGSINLFYTVIFGWILIQDYDFSIKILKITFFIQLGLVFYESLSSSLIFNIIESGVFAINKFDYESLNISTAGFRPKGLFQGTLVASSFVIYLSMIFRNNIKMLYLIFLMSILVNGRLALLISGFILLFKLFKKYDIIIFYKKINPIKKIFFFLFPFLFFIIILFLILPSVNLQNLLNSFNFDSMANAGRLYSYGQSIVSYLNYDIFSKLVGSASNEIFDIYGRVVASESGVLSMFLDIGLIGVLFYSYYFIKVWRTDRSFILDLDVKKISFKFVLVLSLLAFFQYEHINGNLRGILFWFLFLTQLTIDSKNKIRGVN